MMPRNAFDRGTGSLVAGGALGTFSAPVTFLIDRTFFFVMIGVLIRVYNVVRIIVVICTNAHVKINCKFMVHNIPPLCVVSPVAFLSFFTEFVHCVVGIAVIIPFVKLYKKL